MRNGKGFSLLELLIVVAIILIIATIAIPSLLRSRQSAQESSAVAQLRTINTAEVTYIGSNQGSYGDVPSLVTQGLLDQRFAGSISGYNFSIAVSGNVYTANANAVSANAGRFDFFTTADYVLRYATDPTRAPAGLTGEPVR
jgi:prepilin-type N-terminal cleavage/methylation domain-containing protein